MSPPTVAAEHRRALSSESSRGEEGDGVATILVVEDEPTLLATVAYNLRREGHIVLTADDGEAALSAAAEEPDLVVLDVLLPKIDGFEVCRRLRRKSSVPILMLSAKSDEVDRVVGLELGADDYLTKPFSMRELLARVKALLRRRELLAAEVAERTRNAVEAAHLVSGDLQVDVAGHRVTRAGNPVSLTPREFDLLAFLVRHRGQVFSAERLIEQVWGYDSSVDTGTVPVHIRTLREKIEEQPSEPRRIETVRGVGYRFAG
jgi:DNA-binding response OmpR family regulator